MKFPLFPSLALGMIMALPLFAADSVADLPAIAEYPDPLVAANGARVTSLQEWREKRMPELKRLIQHYEYGYLPAAPAAVQARVLFTDAEALNGKATVREIELSWSTPTNATAHLLLVTPNGRPTPPAVFLGLNFDGNHTLLDHPKIWIPDGYVRDRIAGTDNRADEEGRGKAADHWNIALAIERGYAMASIFFGEIIPDKADLAEAALAKYRPASAGERGPDDPGAIAVWAWGLMRAVDYLATDSSVDAKRIAVVGHSRNGKAALVAAAFDERIAMAIPSQAGCGATSPVRVAPELTVPDAKGRPKAETVAVINRSFPHWFGLRFRAIGAAPEKLPFDHHSLIAVCAPRPVLLSNATDDLWANPAGQFAMLKAAAPVYDLVTQDKQSLTAADMPPVGTLLDSRLGYFIRPGKHSMTEMEWKAWLDYADKWLR